MAGKGSQSDAGSWAQINFWGCKSGLEGRIECTVTEFEDVLEEKATIQRSQQAVELWPTRMSFNMRYSSDKRQVLNAGWNNPKQQHQLGTGWLDGCSAEKGQGVLPDSKLNMSQPCVLAAAQANSILG